MDYTKMAESFRIVFKSNVIQKLFNYLLGYVKKEEGACSIIN